MQSRLNLSISQTNFSVSLQSRAKRSMEIESELFSTQRRASRKITIVKCTLNTFACFCVFIVNMWEKKKSGKNDKETFWNKNFQEIFFFLFMSLQKIFGEGQETNPNRVLQNLNFKNFFQN